MSGQDFLEIDPYFPTGVDRKLQSIFHENKAWILKPSPFPMASPLARGLFHLPRGQNFAGFQKGELLPCRVKDLHPCIAIVNRECRAVSAHRHLLMMPKRAPLPKDLCVPTPLALDRQLAIVPHDDLHPLICGHRYLWLRRHRAFKGTGRDNRGNQTSNHVCIVLRTAFGVL